MRNIREREREMAQLKYYYGDHAKLRDRVMQNAGKNKPVEEKDRNGEEKEWAGRTSHNIAFA